MLDIMNFICYNIVIMGGKLKSQNLYNALEDKEKLKKARLKEKAILLIEKKGIKIENAFKKYGLKVSAFSYPRIYKNYKRKGINGLIDKRDGRRIEKITTNIKKYILFKKNENKKLNASQIKKIVQKQFDLKVHLNSISNILRNAGLSNRKGRPRKEIKKIFEKAIDHAGGFLIKGALIKMGLIKVITDRIRKQADKINKENRDELKWM